MHRWAARMHATPREITPPKGLQEGPHSYLQCITDDAGYRIEIVPIYLQLRLNVCDLRATAYPMPHGFLGLSLLRISQGLL